MADIFVAVEQVLPLISGQGSNPFGEAVTQSLSIIQHVKNNPYIAILSSHMALVQKAAVHRSIYNVSVNQSFLMHGALDTKPWQRMLQSLLMTQRVTLGPLKKVKQKFNPTQSVITCTGKNAANSLVFAQATHFNIIKVLQVHQAMIWKQGASNFKIGAPYLFVFTPLNGPNDSPEIL